MRGGRDYRRDGGRGEERRGGHRWSTVMSCFLLPSIELVITLSFTINWKFLGRGLDLVTEQLVVMGEREGATGETNLLLIKKNINIISITYCEVLIRPQLGIVRYHPYKISPTPCLRIFKSSHKCITIMRIWFLIQSEFGWRVKMVKRK